MNRVGRAKGGIGSRFAAALLCAIAAFCTISTVPASAQPVADITATARGGYGRIVFTFDTPPEHSSAQLAGSVVVVSFSEPVEVNVRDLPQMLPDYVSVARDDPDGRSLRFALAQPVTLHTMEAGNKVFVDMMPAGWKGLPPGLPDDVVADLTRRAREAESAKARLAAIAQKDLVPVTVQVGTHPNFTRLVFAFDPSVSPSFSENDGEVRLTFPAPLQFDVAAARATLPLIVTDLHAETADDKLTVVFRVADETVRGFRDDDSFIVDILKTPETLAVQSGAASLVDLAHEAKTSRKAEDKPKVANAAIEAPPSMGLANKNPAPAAAPAKAEPEAEKPAPASPDTAASAPPAPSEPAPAEKSAPVPAPSSPEPAASKAAPAPAPAPPPSDQKTASAKAGQTDVRVVENTLRVTLPIPATTPAAAFMRGSTAWIVVDKRDAKPLTDVAARSNGIVGAVTSLPLENGTAYRLTLKTPHLLTLGIQDGQWVASLGDAILETTRPITLRPSFAPDGRTELSALMDDAGAVHWITDPDVGDRLAVVTARPPIRGVVRGRDFVEFRALPTAQGLVFQPLADDLQVRAGVGEVLVSRGDGLALSIGSAPAIAAKAVLKAGSPFEEAAWNKARTASWDDGEALKRAAAMASPGERDEARIALAKFDLARGNAADAKAVLDVARADSAEVDRNPDVHLMRGAALIILRRFDEAVRELSNPLLSGRPEAALWRMVAEAGRGNIAQARQAWIEGEPVLAAMPKDLQQAFRQTVVEMALAGRDYATAMAQLDALDALGPGDKARRDLLRGQIAQGTGKDSIALDAYQKATEGKDPIAAADARLRIVQLRYQTKAIDRPTAIAELERITTAWRGDSIEATALAALARLYAAEGRNRDAFNTLRTATGAFPEAPSTRSLQSDMARLFAKLMLGEDDTGPANLESVALFYDFKELTPPGRRGDAMIRRLADRLVEVDLLDQAADLLEYQIKNRLTGAGRAQVAATAALIHLMNHKPARAEQIIASTRMAGLPKELVRSRLVLEARALSEIGRTDLSLELLDGLDGDDIQHLRSDILWNAGRWQQAAEALERQLGNRWQRSEALDDRARNDVLRAGVAYALADDALGLDRLRAKYAGKMAATDDAHAFDVVTEPAARRGQEFSDLAKTASVTDTLDAFIAEYRKNYAGIAPPVPTTKPSADAPARPQAKPGAADASSAAPAPAKERG